MQRAPLDMHQASMRDASYPPRRRSIGKQAAGREGRDWLPVDSVQAAPRPNPLTEPGNHQADDELGGERLVESRASVLAEPRCGWLGLRYGRDY